MPDLGTTWFVLVALLLAGYAVLDGFDLGVGLLHLPIARTDHERRVMLAAIAPVWDGNEVWLLAGGGALFAAFPAAYATLFSGLYVPLILVLAGLVVRAVALEFRSKGAGPAWRRAWDGAFAIGSFLPALLLGVAAGNILRGLPLRADGELAVRLGDLLNGFAVGTGLLALAVFMLQGAAWLLLRTEGVLARRAARAAFVSWAAVVVLWLVLLVASPSAAPGLWRPYVHVHSAAFLFPAIFHVALLALPFALVSTRRAAPFLFSSLATLALFGMAAQGLYPNLIPSAAGTASITIYDAASSPRTLSTMLAIALVGMPLVLVYTVFIYRRFRGTVVMDEDGY